MAQKTAFLKMKKVEVVWRGFSDIVEPNGLEFTTSQVRGRLVRALHEILKIHNISHFPANEQKVIFISLQFKNSSFIII